MAQATFDTGLEQHKLYDIPTVAGVLGLTVNRMRLVIASGAMHARRLKPRGEWLIPGWAVSNFIADGMPVEPAYEGCEGGKVGRNGTDGTNGTNGREG